MLSMMYKFEQVAFFGSRGLKTNFSTGPALKICMRPAELANIFVRKSAKKKLKKKSINFRITYSR